MSPVWFATLGLLAGVGIVAGLVDALLGAVPALSFLSFGLALLLLRERRYLYALWRWAEQPDAAPLPPAFGAWDDLFARLYRRSRAVSRQHASLTDALVSFRRAAQALPDGVVTLNEQNQILWCNVHASEHLGLQLSGDAGQNVANLVRSPDFLAYLARGEWDGPIHVRMRGGPQVADRVLSLQLVAYGDGQKLLMSRDVTSIEKLETMRRDFVANVSHELKTPLTVLSGFLETIREIPLTPDQQRQYLDLMTEQATRMEHLVTDLLVLSALEGNRHPVDEAIDMDKLLAKIEDTARQLSGDQHRIEFDVTPGLNVLGAETEITSALTNLVTNAIRYTPPGGSIHVRWRADRDINGGADGTAARFAVQDTGIGIEAQHVPRLTERFYRVDRSRSRESGGTGLGLAIVKHVLTRHQARLEIDSKPGVGSCFAAVFPARRIVRGTARTETRTEAPVALSS